MAVQHRQSDPGRARQPGRGARAQLVRLPLLNDDMHVVGWELARVGPNLPADIRRIALDGRHG